MAENIIIRKTRGEDFEKAIKMYHEFVGDFSAPDGISKEELWLELLADPSACVSCVEEEGQLLAISAQHFISDQSPLGRLYSQVDFVVTLKAAQGRGLGRRLAQHVIDKAWEKGCYKIVALTGIHEQARDFYERLGFESDQEYAMTLYRNITLN